MSFEVVAKGSYGEIGLTTSLPKKHKDGPKKGEYKLDHWLACLEMDGFSTYSTRGMLDLRDNCILRPKSVEKGDWEGCRAGNIR